MGRHFDVYLMNDFLYILARSEIYSLLFYFCTLVIFVSRGSSESNISVNGPYLTNDIIIGYAIVKDEIWRTIHLRAVWPE
jgi:hypothetical protein